MLYTIGPQPFIAADRLTLENSTTTWEKCLKAFTLPSKLGGVHEFTKALFTLHKLTRGEPGLLSPGLDFL